jgi:predicted secreted hydrolase
MRSRILVLLALSPLSLALSPGGGEGRKTSSIAGEPSPPGEGRKTSSTTGEPSPPGEGRKTSSIAGKPSPPGERRKTSSTTGEPSPPGEGRKTSSIAGEPSPPGEGRTDSPSPPAQRGERVGERGDAWRPAGPDHRWSFPADHRAHPGYRNEWWYFTGTVEATDAPGRRFGYQLTFFRVGLVPRAPAVDSAWAVADAVMVHAAVTDIDAGTHAFSDVLWRAVPLLGGFPPEPDPVVAWARAPAGTEGRWELRAEGRGFRLAMQDAARGLAIDLALEPTKAPVLQGPNGLSRKSAEEGYASLYVSLTRLATSGTLEVGGRRHAVRGESWMDQEIGSSQLAPDQIGWDWWSLRLADGRDLMLYVLRRRDGSASWRNATLVERDGGVRLLGPDEWAVRATGTWRSDASGATYPSGWEVTLRGEALVLVVTPEVAAAENRSSSLEGLSYWEGPVRVLDAAGRSAGEGYVELTGYAPGAHLPL